MEVESDGVGGPVLAAALGIGSVFEIELVWVAWDELGSLGADSPIRL